MVYFSLCTNHKYILKAIQSKIFGVLIMSEESDVGSKSFEEYLFNSDLVTLQFPLPKKLKIH